jgi:HD-like signal output (HDOD) protein
MHKKCVSCGLVYKDEHDLFKSGSLFRFDQNKSLWFSCACKATLSYEFSELTEVLRNVSRLSPEAVSTFFSMPALQTLPVLPSAISKLMKILEDPNVTSAQIAAGVKQVPTTAANIIKLANDMKRELSGDHVVIKNLEHAVSFVGILRVMEMLPICAILDIRPDNLGNTVNEFWEASYLTGRIAETLVVDFKERINADPFEAYLAGVMANVGKVIMAVSTPENFTKIWDESYGAGALWTQIEEKMGVVPHTVLGEIAVSYWGLPDYITLCTQDHHKMPERIPSKLSLVHVISFANQLTHWVGLTPNRMDQALCDRYALAFGFSDPRQLDRYVEQKLLKLAAA